MDSSEIDHHGVHLIGIDGDAIPCHAVTSLPEHPPDHAFHHAAHKLIPRGLIVATKLYTCFGGVVEELIVLNPQGGVPCFVGCPTVVGGEGEIVGHGSFRFDGISLDAHGAVTLQECAVHPLSHAALTIDQQAHHVTAAAEVPAHRSAVPLDDGGTGQRGEDDDLTGGAATLHGDEHGHLRIDDGAGDEVHCGLFELRLVYRVRGQRLAPLCQCVRCHSREFNQGDDCSDSCRTKPHAEDDTEQEITLANVHQ